MYPNEQDVLPLPPRPDIEQYRRRAKDLARACRDRGGDGIRDWSDQWMRDVVRLTGHYASDRETERGATLVTAFAQKRLGAECALAQAQFVIARAHGFSSWDQFARHLHDLALDSSETGAFERAVEAIVAGDADTLRALLREYPGLIRARSTRDHHSNLLHYVSANGMENYRQVTPANIVSIARMLLDSGADVNAEADMYGGGSTALNLTATSAHPRAAGVQIELLDLLLARGARMNPGIVRDCLANGCPEAARYLAGRGAPVDWVAACGIGELDVVRRGLATRGLPTGGALRESLEVVSWYGRTDVLTLLLDQGMPVDTRISPGREGHTVLHMAAYRGDVAMVELVLRRGARVNLVDDRYGTVPFVWALQAWLVEGKGPAEAFRSVLWRLAEAGAVVEPRFLEGDELERWPELLARLADNAGRKS